eukprot:CAMPEP_0177514380 /NCGR_PEP_ID=MMETSP0369-20130122/44283_1 /TAXON_ID=447022 ORGANISM="Scrippsiella hangoei-like, Strain SHHI-4" /NCGR_SAMPLE_ID=MMETSP0369 /ASSEMBLY_ACC=CAM_ASM_000364 /LENGTH=187 /DNA_ID=CAMNT_0018993061 /DNA_START=883 /DNA_END=1444 /DNA_ORIENTATION=+
MSICHFAKPIRWHERLSGGTPATAAPPRVDPWRPTPLSGRASPQAMKNFRRELETAHLVRGRLIVGIVGYLPLVARFLAGRDTWASESRTVKRRTSHSRSVAPPSSSPSPRMCCWCLPGPCAWKHTAELDISSFTEGDPCWKEDSNLRASSVEKVTSMPERGSNESQRTRSADWSIPSISTERASNE